MLKELPSDDVAFPLTAPGMKITASKSIPAYARRSRRCCASLGDTAIPLCPERELLGQFLEKLRHTLQECFLKYIVCSCVVFHDGSNLRDACRLRHNSDGVEAMN